jgi:hypothetical protein
MTTTTTTISSSSSSSPSPGSGSGCCGRSSRARRGARSAAVLLSTAALSSALLAGCSGQVSAGRAVTPPIPATGGETVPAGGSPSASSAAPPVTGSPSAAGLLAGAAPVLGSVAPYPTVRATGTPVRAVRGPAPTASVNAVAVGGVIALGSADTTIDTDPNATARRAVTWLDPAFAAQVRAFPPIQAPGAQWAQWASHRAALRVTARLGGDEHPPDTASTAYRQVLATVTPVGRDGWRGPVQQQVWFVSLTRTAGRWLLASARSG